MKTVKKLGYVAAALALSASFAGCGMIPNPISQGGGTPAPQEGNSAEQEGGDTTASGWPEVNRQAFLKSCEATSGGKSAYCECALQESEKNFTFDEMQKLERRAATDPSAVDEMQGVIQTCAHLAS
ncbi:hypothetical protein JD292_08460 [Leucobacter sp. CSA2]|uniref:Uncharacterized protein n=1 Tax=Leucobacter edaphi TaxID=2796472 RepID=A0A934UXX2_9MICO|nr:hypothetical protein [Leucobacter edaphi]MBK0422106.1 hypothetical protein [Leucobacter edaphi]